MIRITKPLARKLYDEGKEIYLLPCKVAPKNPWITPYRAIKTEDGDDFDMLVACYTAMNCNSPLGRYIRFYKEEN